MSPGFGGDQVLESKLQFVEEKSFIKSEVFSLASSKISGSLTLRSNHQI